MVKLLTNLSYKPDAKSARLIKYGTETELLPEIEARLVNAGKAEIVNAEPYKGEPAKIVNEPTAKQPEPEPEPESEPEPMSDALEELDLDTASRVQLNNYASDLGVESPEKLPNRAAVIKAIEKALQE